jgi:hypothetical protein
MTQENRETMQRAMGIIEGVSFGSSERVQNALACVIAMLDDVLRSEGEQ